MPEPGDIEGRFKKKTYKGITRDEAVRLERGILAARDRGERQPDVRTAPSFGNFATAWIEENRSGWKASTLQQYEQVLKSQLRPAFADLRLSYITESRIKQLVTDLQDGGLSARRINLIVLVFKMIVRAALKQRLIRENPGDRDSEVERNRAPRLIHLILTKSKRSCRHAHNGGDPTAQSPSGQGLVPTSSPR